MSAYIITKVAQCKCRRYLEVLRCCTFLNNGHSCVLCHVRCRVLVFLQIGSWDRGGDWATKWQDLDRCNGKGLVFSVFASRQKLLKSKRYQAGAKSVAHSSTTAAWCHVQYPTLSYPSNQHLDTTLQNGPCWLPLYKTNNTTAWISLNTLCQLDL